jgi:hypothetical protein
MLTETKPRNETRIAYTASHANVERHIQKEQGYQEPRVTKYKSNTNMGGYNKIKHKSIHNEENRIIRELKEQASVFIRTADQTTKPKAPHNSCPLV